MFPEQVPEDNLLPLLRRFEVEEASEGHYTEDQVLEMLSRRIAWLMEHRMEFLFSQLYRMDIDERQVRQVLDPAHSNEDPAIGLARLVMRRQMERLRTKKDIRVDEIDPDMAW